MQPVSFKFRVSALIAVIFSMACASAQAAPHKCVGANGKVEYTDGPCKTGSTEKPIKAKPVTVLKSEDVSGKPMDAAQKEKANDHRPKWLKEANETFDPVAQCKAKGGTIDTEFRACKLP
jgi:Domain of unknown function (DUF4124)